MKRLLCAAVVLALAAAKPEMYKETEDFQFQRSSTDEGSKSGFYGAQRGNMGGNYERAHNMDGLAQHQMSGAVQQTEGELGDAANTRTGSVFTSANSKGIYGSGRYDLSNLQGRNFQENINHGNSHSQSSQSSQSSDYQRQLSYDRQNAAYNSQSQNSRHNGYYGSNNYRQASNLQATGMTQGAAVHDYGSQANSQSSGSYAQSGYDSQSSYGSSNTNYNSGAGYRVNPSSQLIGARPVRVSVRPGSRVAVPVGVQTYDATHSASTLDQNSINSDAETFGTTDQRTGYKPTAHAKGYESSYSYRKQWEKHDTKPEIVMVAVPTDNPYPKNSELYDDAQTLQASSNNYQASGLDSQYARSSGYNANTKSSASQSSYQSAAESQQKSSSSQSNSNVYSNANGAYNSGSSVDSANALGASDSRPKGYHSSYSYHKSWERQGDPYEIKPVGGAYDGQASSQRLTSASNNQGYSSHQYGTKNHQSHQGYAVAGVDCDCDENGHIRIARSPNSNQQTRDWQNMEQLGNTKDDLQELQPQHRWGKFRPRHQSQSQGRSGKLEDLGEQTQNTWDQTNDLGQQTQERWGNLEDLQQRRDHRGSK